MTTFTWLVSIAALVGVWLNIKKNRWCFAIWLLTNFSWFWIDLEKGIHAQAALQYIYCLLSIHGLLQWSRSKVGATDIESPLKAVEEEPTDGKASL